MKELLQESFGYIFEEELIDAIASVGRLKKMREGETLMDYGETIKFMPLLLNGAVKILREDPDGEELLVYFIERGDTCAMTLNCCMGRSKSEIHAVAEQDSLLVMIPVEKMSQWVKDFDSWRAFVFESFNGRLKEMLEAIDSLAFMNMHERIQKYLKEKAVVNHSAELSVTHQEIANDLHSSRVVISRVLKSLERAGKIKLHRNRIEVIDF